jgi:hypothetical protein
VVRPWLAAAPGRLSRRYVVVPTRGQSHALKQRCMMEGVPLMGVEFLTPGLARQKWLALAGASRPAMRDELLVFGLRILIESRLAGLGPEDAAGGFWKSLLSDVERALREFEALLNAGFGAEHFSVPQLREVFGALTAWVESLGYTLAPRQSVAAALTPVAPEAARPGEATLIYGFSGESWVDFFDLAAFARRGGDLTVVLPEPELRGARALDESWIEMWEALLGVEAATLDALEPASCAEVAALWMGEGGAAGRARVLVGHTRTDEMALLAGALADLLASGADNVAVIFPRAGAAHLRLARLLTVRGLPFADLLTTVGPPTVDEQLQRALLAFYSRGARLEELLGLWPLLRALNFVRHPLGAVRMVCERVFDELQTHTLAACRPRLAAGEDQARRELVRVTDLLLPAWPEELTLADAAQRFEAICGRFNLAPPSGWSALTALAERETCPRPTRVVLAAFESLLPATSPVLDAPGRGVFAPITLTTRRRAAGLAWSHVVLAESNAGSWPERVESSCWLPDDQRRALDATKRFSLGLFTGDDRRLLARQAYAAIAGDAREQVIFTAALFEEEEPELRLAPNAWLERVLLAQGPPENRLGDLERVFSSLARVGPREPAGETDAATGDWAAVWQRRRDPAVPFDDHFLAGPPAITRPTQLAARLIERGVEDPAVLWFEAVLGVRQVGWRPLVRARKKSLGQMAHRLLAQALSGPPAEAGFRRKPGLAEARVKLTEMLAALRTQWPGDRYWDSFYAELAETAGRLLEKVYALETGSFVVVEAALPPGASIPLEGGERLAVRGRMDLAFLDRPEWSGAQVDIVDFKTGAEGAMSAARMARGESLQLGIYLAAAESLGAAGGRVWMLKPDAAVGAALELSELPVALTALRQIGRHLTTGCYGALTPDRTEFTRGFEWPLACTPVRHAVLAQKFALTFGPAAAAPGGETADE